MYKLEHERNLSGCLQSIKSTQDNTKDLYETQVRQLKETIESQEREIESAKAEHKLQSTKLQSAVQSLEKEIEHLKRIQMLELQEVRNELQAELHRERRALERESEVSSSAHNLALKRLRN